MVWDDELSVGGSGFEVSGVSGCEVSSSSSGSSGSLLSSGGWSGDVGSEEVVSAGRTELGTMVDAELDPYWRVIEGSGECPWGVDSRFFEKLSERVWYKVYLMNPRMVEVLRRTGWDYEDMRQEVVLRMFEVWDRVDWGVRSRHKIFSFFVKCGWQVLALRYRRVKRAPLEVSYEEWLRSEGGSEEWDSGLWLSDIGGDSDEAY